jgi:hypothetical protein
MTLKDLEDDFIEVSAQGDHKPSKQGAKFKRDWFEQGELRVRVLEDGILFSHLPLKI